MNLQKAILLGLIPLAGGAMVVAAIAMRLGDTKKGPASPPVSGREAAILPCQTQKPLVVAAPVRRPEVAPEKTVATRSEDVRIRSTYQNYRTAIATRNVSLEQALRPVLLKDRDAARHCAEEDLARAQSELDRSIARRVIEDLRR